MRKLKLLFLTFVFLIIPLIAGAAEKDRLAVMDIQDSENIFDAKTQIKFTDYIFTKFQITGVYWMIPKADRDTALEQAIADTAEGSRKQCVDEKCQISLTAQLQANFLINTEIKKLYEGTCQISIRKFDVEKRAGVDAWEEKFDCTDKGIYGAIDSFNFTGKKSAFQAGRISEEALNMNVEAEDSTIVKIVTEPTEAIVLVDGIMICQKTPCSKMIAFGKHQVTIQKENYVPHQKEYDVKAGLALNLILEPNFGWVTINSEPSGMEIELDGKDLGVTPISKRIIETGGHQAQTKNKCHYNEMEKFVIKRGEDKVITFKMNPRESALKVTAKDEQDNDLEAEVMVDGNPVGKTPKTWKVPLCSDNIYVKADVGEFTQKLSLTEGEIKVVDAVLKKAVVYTPPPASTAPAYNNYNYDYSSRRSGSGKFNLHGLMSIPVGGVFDKAFYIGIDFGLEIGVGSGSKADYHRFFSWSILARMGIVSDFNFDKGFLGMRSFDFKLNTKLNFWYLAGGGPQVEALLGTTGYPNKYLVGVSMWAINLPIYLWTDDRSGFNITLLNVDMGWDYNADYKKGQIVFYTSFEFMFH